MKDLSIITQAESLLWRLAEAVFLTLGLLLYTSELFLDLNSDVKLIHFLDAEWGGYNNCIQW